MSKKEIRLQQTDLVDFLACIGGGLVVTIAVIYALQFTKSVYCVPVITEQYQSGSSFPRQIGFDSNTTKARITSKSYFGKSISVPSKEFNGTFSDCESFQTKQYMAGKGLIKDLPITILIGICFGLIVWLVWRYFPKIKIQK